MSAEHLLTVLAGVESTQARQHCITTPSFWGLGDTITTSYGVSPTIPHRMLESRLASCWRSSEAATSGCYLISIPNWWKALLETTTMFNGYDLPHFCLSLRLPHPSLGFRDKRSSLCMTKLFLPTLLILNACSHSWSIPHSYSLG